MNALLAVLERKPSGEQLEILAQYPQQAVEKAYQKLKRTGKKRSFNYFLAIVKDVTPTRTVTSRPRETPSYVRTLPNEDPLYAVIRICQNLVETTTVGAIVLTPEKKRRVALKDPWFDKLTHPQQKALLVKYPFYERVAMSDK